MLTDVEHKALNTIVEAAVLSVEEIRNRTVDREAKTALTEALLYLKMANTILQLAKERS